MNNDLLNGLLEVLGNGDGGEAPEEAWALVAMKNMVGTMIKDLIETRINAGNGLESDLTYLRKIAEMAAGLEAFAESIGDVKAMLATLAWMSGRMLGVDMDAALPILKAEANADFKELINKNLNNN